MDTRLDSLDIGFRIRAFELLARCPEARIPVVVVNTRRTAAEQAQLLHDGHAWVTHSAHQDGRAIDICPLEVFDLSPPGTMTLACDPAHPIWERVGPMVVSLELVG